MSLTTSLLSYEIDKFNLVNEINLRHMNHLPCYLSCRCRLITLLAYPSMWITKSVTQKLNLSYISKSSFYSTWKVLFSPNEFFAVYDMVKVFALCVEKCFLCVWQGFLFWTHKILKETRERYAVDVFSPFVENAYVNMHGFLPHLKFIHRHA